MRARQDDGCAFSSSREQLEIIVSTQNSGHWTVTDGILSDSRSASTYCQEVDGSPAPPLQPDVQAAAHDCDDMWYEDAFCDDGYATAANYEDEDETTDVENYQEVANDVFVEGATYEQVRKFFALERRIEGKRHTKPFHSVQFSLFTLYLTC